MYKLFIEQKVFKITDHYEVIDQNDRPVYQVDQDFKFLGNTVNVKKIDGSKSFYLDRRILTWFPTYDVVFDDGKSFEIKQALSFMKKKIEVYSANYDLKLEGNFWDYEFLVWNGGVLIGEITKEIFRLRDSYAITIHDPSYEEEMVALTIALDDIKDMEQRSN